MRAGEIVGGRFQLERLAGSGGMGEVYKALDRVTGEPVAIKLLLATRNADVMRFEREARVLGDLSHPGIVRYVSHGVAPSGTPYLAMEWLDGEDLLSRLLRQPLSIDEALALATRTAEALSAAHARDIIHRDLKPTNLFLVEGDIRQVKVLDFGVAKLGGMTRVTRTGMLVGTPGYMAPEQARSGQPVDARADVFSLGCVLYECLTGEPAFTGEHFMAVLGKVLFEEPPRLRDRRAEVPASLDALVTRMLAKEPDDRLRDGAALLSALEKFRTTVVEDVPPSLPVARSFALTTGERRALSMVLMGYEQATSLAEAETLGEEEMAQDRELHRSAEECGGHFDRLADGSVVVTFLSTRLATDQAAVAARCALRLRDIAKSRPIVLVTGRSEVVGRTPMGEAVDRAARILSQLTPTWASTGASAQPRPVGLDEVTAGLLDARFDVREGEAGLWLWGERELLEGARTLLGKPTSCVGRERELSTIEQLLSESVEEPVAQAVLVTAPAGVGKSRVAQEVIHRLQERRSADRTNGGGGTGPPSSPRFAVWIGRSDSLRAGSPFGLLGQALRSACGIVGGEPLEARRAKLAAKVAESVPAAAARRVTEFLGELIGTPMPDEESTPLRAARRDAQLMADQMLRAWQDFLRAELTRGPVLLVLEDLHWGDLSTVRFVDAALRELSDKPWMVLALARPEVHELFPKLWADRRIEEIRLKELSRKASERLVRQVLGEGVGPDTIERLVAQAVGNAFYLEELIRATAERQGKVLPETVLAMVQSRLELLDRRARRALRAASIFGEVFWEGGVTTLLGSEHRPSDVGALLSSLVDRELIARRSESRFPGENEYAFRHALLREGAYAMLTAEDLALGHRLAGEWLEARDATDAIVLAEHFERGQSLARAGRYYELAAQQAHRGNDTDLAMSRARRGLAFDVGDEVRVALLSILCEAPTWRNDWSAGAAYADEVLRLTSPGSTPWAVAMLVKLGDALQRGQLAEYREMVGALLEIDPEPGAVGSLAQALALAIFILDSQGDFALAASALRRSDAIVEGVASEDPIARGWNGLAHAYHEPWANEDPWAGLVHAQKGCEAFKEANHQRGALAVQIFIGMNAWFLGDLARADRELRATLVVDQELGLLSPLRTYFFAETLADRGQLEEARRVAAGLVDAGSALGITMLEARGRAALATVLLRQGDLDAAEREALASIDLLAGMRLEQTAARAVLAAARLAKGRADEALAGAREAMAACESLGSFGLRGALVRLVFAEALWAAGDRDGARAAITAAGDRLKSRAAAIPDAAISRSFLESVPENARTLDLVRRWAEQAG
jgi:tetratricopeptide (TPR) repeat protein